MKVAVLCNDALGHPAIAALGRSGALAGVATSDHRHDANLRLAGFAADGGLPFASIAREGRADALCAWLDATGAASVFVIAFPYRVPRAPLERARWFNFHAGALPANRGPDPLFWQVRDGATEVTLTAHAMEPTIDTGAVVATRAVPLAPTDTYGVARSRIAAALVELVPALRRGLSAGEVDGVPQAVDGPTGHGRPEPSDLVVDWGASAARTQALVRACNPTHGGALASLGGRQVHLLEVVDVGAVEGAEPGAVVSITAAGPWVATGDGRALELRLVYLDEGFFTGAVFAGLFGLRPGARLDVPAGAFEESVPR